MLRLDQIDLDDVVTARDDHSAESSWWLDPATGAIEPWVPDVDEGEREHPEEAGWAYVEPRPSSEAYQDMADFAALVRDPRARDLLDRALTGRGAFRRFKDTVFGFPELGPSWVAFRDARSRRDALGWLADAGLVDRAEAERACLSHPDATSPLLGPRVDAEAIAAAVAADLRELYGDRLHQVLLFGSYARGTAIDGESDVDLLVVLDEVRSAYDELETMGDVMWQHTLDNCVAVSAVPVSRARWRASETPFLQNVLREGRAVA